MNVWNWFDSVMLFAGPPGHGKTELATQLGKLVVSSEESSIKIQCETLETKWELQGNIGNLCHLWTAGSALGYQGNDKGSPLNNFVGTHNGKDGVVVLDEFEKTGSKKDWTLLNTTKDMACKNHCWMCLRMENGGTREQRVPNSWTAVKLLGCWPPMPSTTTSSNSFPRIPGF